MVFDALYNSRFPFFHDKGPFLHMTQSFDLGNGGQSLQSFQEHL